MGTLNVTTYRVGTNRSRANPQAHRFFLTLEGFAESGAATSAVVYFWPTQPTDTVGYVAGSLLVGMLDDADFAGWYDILRSERPVKVTYVEGSAGESKVWHISVGTTSEGVGEGPRDPNA
jgi:hypothetical protein